MEALQGENFGYPNEKQKEKADPIKAEVEDRHQDDTKDCSPVVYPAPTIAPIEFLRKKRYVNAANDIVETFGLLPIYKAVLEPYISERNSRKNDRVDGQDGDANDSNQAASGFNKIQPSSSSPPVNLAPSTSSPIANPFNPTVQSPLNPNPNTIANSNPQSPPPLLSNPTPTIVNPNNSSKISKNQKLTIEKTFSNYVSDLPGRVRPSKREIQTKDDRTMRDIVFRPETTLQEIKRFDRDVMDNAFSVEGGEVKGIDSSLLEPDDHQQESKKKKKKEKNPNHPNQNHSNSSKRKRELTGPSTAGDGSHTPNAANAGQMNPMAKSPGGSAGHGSKNKKRKMGHSNNRNA